MVPAPRGGLQTGSRRWRGAAARSITPARGGTLSDAGLPDRAPSCRCPEPQAPSRTLVVHPELPPRTARWPWAAPTAARDRLHGRPAVDQPLLVGVIRHATESLPRFCRNSPPGLCVLDCGPLVVCGRAKRPIRPMEPNATRPIFTPTRLPPPTRRQTRCDEQPDRGAAPLAAFHDHLPGAEPSVPATGRAGVVGRGRKGLRSGRLVDGPIDGPIVGWQVTFRGRAREPNQGGRSSLQRSRRGDRQQRSWRCGVGRIGRFAIGVVFSLDDRSQARAQAGRVPPTGRVQLLPRNRFLPAKNKGTIPYAAVGSDWMQPAQHRAIGTSVGCPSPRLPGTRPGAAMGLGSPRP